MPAPGVRDDSPHATALRLRLFAGVVAQYAFDQRAFTRTPERKQDMNLASIRPVAVQQAKEAESSTEASGSISILDEFEVAELKEYKVPFPVIFTWDVVKDKASGKVIDARNARFFCSQGKENKSFECRPVIEPGTAIDAYNGEEGELVVRYTDNGSPVHREVRNGHTYLEIVPRPKFVSFNGKAAVKFANIETVKPTLLAVMRELYPESTQPAEKQKPEEKAAKK